MPVMPAPMTATDAFSDFEEFDMGVLRPAARVLVPPLSLA